MKVRRGRDQGPGTRGKQGNGEAGKQGNPRRSSLPSALLVPGPWSLVPGPTGLRHPDLGSLPRASLGTFPSPVERVATPGGDLWLKRDDLNAPVMGGNKVRALEFLLAGVGEGDLVLTLGGEGSTHVLATAVHAARLGARTRAVRWRHEMNPVARRVAARIEEECERAPVLPIPLAMATLVAWGLTARRGGQRVRRVPLGGSAPLGILGHVEAALELAAQVQGGILPAPRRLVVPLGSGGTAAGLALGVAMAGLPTEIVAARVGPRMAATQRRVLRLASRTRRLLHSLTGALPPPPAPVRVVHDVYGGAYGRSLPAGDRAALMLHEACAAALTLLSDDGPTLFWVTFDGRAVMSDE